MAALAADRNTQVKGEKKRTFYMPVAASTKIYAGAMVSVVSGTGYAIPAADTASHVVMGRAAAQADNTSGAAGAISVEVETGCFKYAVSSVTQANVGQNATVVDDQTVGVAAGTTNDIVAGKILEIATDGAWVEIG